VKLFKRGTVEPNARAVVNDWLEWLRLSGFSPLTIKSYRLTSAKLLARWPELKLSEFTDEHIIGIIDDAKLKSRQHRRSCFQNLFTWAYRTKRIPFNYMVMDERDMLREKLRRRRYRCPAHINPVQFTSGGR
jgi:hypothetical protein